MTFDFRKVLENSEVFLRLADIAREKIAEGINKNIEDELVKSQMRVHAVEEKLRMSEDELKSTVKDLGETARRLENAELEIRRLKQLEEGGR
jgi:predicted  nucleic acid-binding Zn-ribbon protein